jgi:hypothetical protein
LAIDFDAGNSLLHIGLIATLNCGQSVDVIEGELRKGIFDRRQFPADRLIVPKLSIDDEGGAHFGVRSDRAPVRVNSDAPCGRMGNFAFGLLPASFQDVTRILHSAQLQISVLEPIVVMAAHTQRPSRCLSLLIHDFHCSLVRFYNVLPHAERQKNVRGHVLGVCGVGGYLGINTRRSQAEGRVDGIVIAMNHVMDNAGMARVLREHLLQHRGCAHVGGEVSSFFR